MVGIIEKTPKSVANSKAPCVANSKAHGVSNSKAKNDPIMKPEDKDLEQIKREINKGGVRTATNPVNNYKQ